jgi:hypothetical protein
MQKVLRMRREGILCSYRPQPPADESSNHSSFAGACQYPSTSLTSSYQVSKCKH